MAIRLIAGHKYSNSTTQASRPPMLREYKPTKMDLLPYFGILVCIVIALVWICYSIIRPCRRMFFRVSQVREIRDRSGLRLFEGNDIGGGVFPDIIGVGSVSIPVVSGAKSSRPSSWDQGQLYFSEPEIDANYHQHNVHTSKAKAPAYYIGNQAPSTLPRGGSMLHAFSPAASPVPADRVKTTPAGERGRLKLAPLPKPAGLSGQQLTMVPQRTMEINVSSDFFHQLRLLQKQSRDLWIETRNLRGSTLGHALQMHEKMGKTIIQIGNLAEAFAKTAPETVTREEEIYRQDMMLFENNLYELEATVKRLRRQAANRETRVNMADLERIAMALSKSNKTVAYWKKNYPVLQEMMKTKLATEMDKVVRKEKKLTREPERIEQALQRCRNLSRALVTLKRLACVQELVLPITDGCLSPGSFQGSTSCLAGTADDYSETFLPQTPNNRAGAGALGEIAEEPTCVPRMHSMRY